MTGLRRNHDNGQRGAVLALLALLMPALLGVLALVVDNGSLYALRRKMQSAADAAVITAAQEVRRKNADYKTSAVKDAERNGFTPSATVTVDVNNPPKYGNFAGNTNYVEVQITQQAPLFFMRALNQSSAVVTARAVSGLRPSPACAFVLNPSVDEALDVGGGALVNMPSCSALVNSNSLIGAVTQGSSAMNALVQVVGGYGGDAFTPTPKTGLAPFEDPLRDVPSPPVGACTHNGAFTVNADTTAWPGTYCGGINVKKGTLTLNPGVYIINEGGFNVASGASLKGAGVMIYNTYTNRKYFAPFNMASNYPNVVQLTAPTDGNYKGILLFQDRRVERTYKNYLTKNEGTVYEGYLYFKSSGLRFTGGATLDTTRVVFVADTLELRGNMTIQAPSNIPGGTGDMRIVE